MHYFSNTNKNKQKKKMKKKRLCKHFLNISARFDAPLFSVYLS